MLAAIAIKIWLGKAWMFRRTEVAGSTYLSPNFGFSWQVMIAVFLAGLQVSPEPTPSSVCGATGGRRGFTPGG